MGRVTSLGEYFGLDNHTVESNKSTKHGFLTAIYFVSEVVGSSFHDKVTCSLVTNRHISRSLPLHENNTFEMTSIKILSSNRKHVNVFQSYSTVHPPATPNIFFRNCTNLHETTK